MILAVALIAALSSPYDSAPPGRIVSTQDAYLAGRKNRPWRAVLSKAAAGVSQGETIEQWYLSLYVPSGSHYRLKYRSPEDGGPLEETMKNGRIDATPLREFSIAGTARLTSADRDELLVERRAFSADCGSVYLSIIGVSETGRVVPLTTVDNGCALDVAIVRGAGGVLDTLRLTGPYFGPNSGTCCPTKQRASATLSYRSGAWVVSPAYYELANDTFGM